MSFGKSFEIDVGHRKAAGTTWGASYPNPADINFNYRKLIDNIALDSSGRGGLAIFNNPNFSVAVIGAGIAGLTAARELLRSGVKNVHIYEASERYGGRHFTKVPTNLGQYTPMEGGAMRFPPFLPPGATSVYDGCSLLSYYMKTFSLTSEPFPNPGSNVADTGIFYNNGWLSGEATPTMAIWRKTDSEPPTQALQTVLSKWKSFANQMIKVVSNEYIKPEWPTFWKGIVGQYWHKTFRDVVLDPEVIYDPMDPYNFGGAGMTEEEARLFYMIGGGDGSWGAFYNLSFLYAYRTFVHGFGSNLFLLQGRFNADGTLNPGPHYNESNLTDSWGNQIPPPRYIGACALDDGMLFGLLNVSDSNNQLLRKSIYDLSKERPSGFDVKIYLKTKITGIGHMTDSQGGTTFTKANIQGIDPRNGQGFAANYDAVVLTVPTWQFGTDIQIGFLNDDSEASSNWPFELQTYLSRAHWEPACKVFIALKERYWTKSGNLIPQLITSDTFVHDTYSLVAGVGTPPSNQQPVMLASYTWWRDATKLLSIPDADLVKACVAELDRILMRATNIGQKISQYVDYNNSWVMRWEMMPTYKGAARLYDQREWMDTQLVMAYNQEYSQNSKFYFAGESYGVDAGWTEPCFRSAIDSVLRIARNNRFTLNITDFDFDRDYPLYDVTWRPPEPNSPQS